MGIWKMMKTRQDVAVLETLMSAPIPAWRAPQLFHEILGDDSLFDHFNAARSLDKGADVRSLVINRIEQLYLTQQSIEEVCEFDAAEALETLVSGFRLADDDVFHKLSKLDEAKAVELVMWATDDPVGDATRYTVRRDGRDMDFVVVSSTQEVYRVEAIDGCVTTFSPENAASYRTAGLRSGMGLH